MFLQCIFIGFGGFLGAILRYLLSLPFSTANSMFPFSTLAINFSGSFLIGLFVQYAASHTSLDPKLYLFLTVGLCGGFTTFSTFALETFGMIQQGRLPMGILYAVCSTLLCVLGIWLGKSASQLVS